MSAKILAFDPNRKVPPKRYTPIAMRGRLLSMPLHPAESADSHPAATTVSEETSVRRAEVLSATYWTFGRR